MGVQPARGRRLSGADGSPGPCQRSLLRRNVCRDVAARPLCVFVSPGSTADIYIFCPHIFQHSSFQRRGKDEEKKSPSSCDTQSARRVYALVKDNQDGVFTAAGRSSLAVFGLWPHRTAASGVVVFTLLFGKRGLHFQDAAFIVRQSCEGAQEETAALLL